MWICLILLTQYNIIDLGTTKVVGGSPSVNRHMSKPSLRKEESYGRKKQMLSLILKLIASLSSLFGFAMGVEWLIKKIKALKK